MPRDLSDVLHFFLPEMEREAATETTETAAAPARLSRADSAPALPIVAVPIGDQDVVRAAFSWNIAVEIARMGGRAVVLAPEHDDPSPLWPEAGIGPLGAELIITPAADLGSLCRVATDIASSRAPSADGGLLLVRVPPRWLTAGSGGSPMLRWSLLFTGSSTAELRETFGLTKLLLARNPEARVGVTIHGARKRGEAEDAFLRLASATRKRLGYDIESYGLLVDDLAVYRAIVSQRPIGLEHPQSSAARALRDVALMMLEDARKRIVG